MIPRAVALDQLQELPFGNMTRCQLRPQIAKHLHGQKKAGAEQIKVQSFWDLLAKTN